MKNSGLIAAACILTSLALPACAKTYKSTIAAPCDQVWTAVKATLGNQDNYAQVKADDAKMTASYSPKHSVHVDVSGVLLQRMNKVTLLPHGSGCEMDVVSNYSGWGHNDQNDFKKRVEESLTRQRQPAQPVPPAGLQSEAK